MRNTQVLDRENTTEYLLQITASAVQYGLTRTGTTQLAIILNDVNDNAPIFDPGTPSTVEVSEGAALGFVFIEVRTVFLEGEADGYSQERAYQTVGDGFCQKRLFIGGPQSHKVPLNIEYHPHCCATCSAAVLCRTWCSTRLSNNFSAVSMVQRHTCNWCPHISIHCTAYRHKERQSVSVGEARFKLGSFKIIPTHAFNGINIKCENC